MHHVAIMKKSLKLLPKILSGEKSIESRWYTGKRKPWDVVAKGDTIYFKNTSEPITLHVTVSDVIQFQDLTPKNVKHVLDTYSTQLGIEEYRKKFFTLYKDKKYCILIFLKNPKKVKSFNIDKTGFGAMSAWISVKNIRSVTSQISERI
jgi:ASC-1-like (ASCH) protein